MEHEMNTTGATRTFLTQKNTDNLLSEQPSLAVMAAEEEIGDIVRIDSNVAYQTVEGFGGAFTEAAATTLYKLSEDLQEELLAAYFSPENGHGYALCRTHINSCDFSLGNYAYADVNGDVNLESFDISRDREALIPMIKRAQDVRGSDFRLFASPWSPPAWMKTTGKMNQGGKLKPEYREAWAKYYCRYIDEYVKEGIPIWGLTVQNEPEATQRWDSCIYTAEEERDFVRDYLGPQLEKHGYGDLKVIIWDHNRDRVFERAKVVYDDPKAAKYVWGTGFHWYEGDNFENLKATHDAYPNKKLIFTEGCQEHGPHIGEWELGERYAHSMINDMNNWVVGWTDWNMLLDETGGPNHVGNLCSAPIIADTQNNALLYQSSYYYIGHFARFVKPGAVRVLCATTRDDLEATAFRNPDGTHVCVALNRTDEAIRFALEPSAAGGTTAIPPHSIATYVIAIK